MNRDQLIDSLKQFVETEFWPRHRGVDEAKLLIRRDPDSRWEEIDLFLASHEEGFRRNQILTAAMRQAIAKYRPLAASVIAEMREATDDPHAHYDHVMATLEIRDDNAPRAVQLIWKLGLDDTSLTFLHVGEWEAVTFGNLYSGADDCIEHWVYAKDKTGGRTLLFRGGSFRADPMTVENIKLKAYLWLCRDFGQKLDKTKVLKSLVVSYRPLKDVVP